MFGFKFRHRNYYYFFFLKLLSFFISYLGEMMIKKWKNVRDAYVRSKKKQSSGSSASKKNKTYVYADLLSFIDVTERSIATQSSIDDETASDIGESGIDDNEIPAKKRKQMEGIQTDIEIPRNRLSRKRILEETMIRFMSQKTEEPDEDRSFLESILPAMKKLDENDKHEFKIGLLNSLNRFRNSNYRELTRNATEPRHLTIQPAHNPFMGPRMQPMSSFMHPMQSFQSFRHPTQPVMHNVHQSHRTPPPPSCSTPLPVESNFDYINVETE